MTAIAGALRLAREHPTDALAAVKKALPDRSAGELAVMVPLYTAALPPDPQVSLAAAERTLALFPSIHRAPPSRDALDAAIDNRFAAGG